MRPNAPTRASSRPRNCSMGATAADPGSRTRSAWAARAARVYDTAYAGRYRQHDEEFDRSDPTRRLAEWLRGVCRTFAPPIDVLDLGCGTGRYFWALTGVGDLVGLDASAPMLAEARRPYN